MLPSPRTLLAAALLISSLTACQQQAPVEQQSAYSCDATADPGCAPPALADVEVLLTDPYCDVCTPEDKEVLRARSAIVQRVVALIDGATERIDVAQFTFSVRDIADALLRAHQRGVTVRLAMDKGQDKPGTRSSELLAAGLDVRFVSAKPYADRHGLQHAKFMVVDGDTLLTGSNNFSSTGTSINEENTIVLNDAPEHPVLEGFACHFDAIWEGDWENAGACTNDQAYFTPSSAAFKRLRDEIRAAKRSVDVIMHHLTYTKLVKELKKAAEAGIEVRVLLNETTRDEHVGSAWTDLAAAGGTIRYKRVNEATYQLLHHKLVIIDDRMLINGSGNWSGSAFFNNFENYVVWEHPRVVQPFRRMYSRLWGWSLTGDSLDAGLDAAEQHDAQTEVLFGNLHAHFHAAEGAQDDGDPHVMDEHGEAEPVNVSGVIYEAARDAFAYARGAGMDFMALTPHCHDERPDDQMPNMSEPGFEEMATAADDATQGGFVALAGVEWSTNSTGNHVGILGTSAAAKVERGRFDELYDSFLPRRELEGDRPLLMLNHPKTFRWQTEYLTGNWDMIFDTNLLDIPKVGQRNKKFNDFGLDDYLPLRDVRQSWIEGAAMPDPQIVDETLANLWAASAPYVRLMEVTFNRGKELGGTTPVNPSLVPSGDDPALLERRTKVHRDFDWYLTKGFRIAPIVSHDNHWANWGMGNTGRTGIAVRHRSERGMLDAIEEREVFGSEDQNLALRFYVEGRIPMGGAWATPHATASARVTLTDPDYAGPFTLRVYHGVVGQPEVVVSQELIDLAVGTHELELALDAPGEHFFYLEVHETGADRMAWTAPIWIEHLL